MKTKYKTITLVDTDFFDSFVKRIRRLEKESVPPLPEERSEIFVYKRIEKEDGELLIMFVHASSKYAYKEVVRHE